MTRQSWILAALLAGVAAGDAQNYAPPAATRWPGDRQAAIALTFDDALASHLEHVGPILKRHGLHGTFFVTTGKAIWRNRAADWKQLSEEGNEIAGHTTTHPCLLAGIKPRSQDYTASMMADDIAQNARAVLELTGTHRGLTFAYPCGNIGFGPPAEQTRNAALYVDYVARHFFAARIYDAAGTVNPDGLSILNVADLGETVGRDYFGLLQMMEPVLRERQAGVFTFHGVGGDYLAVSSEALDELAAYLERHPEIWTSTFGDLIRYVQESHALSIQRAAGEGSAEYALSWPLDASIFDLPLTLRWKLPPGWTAMQAEVDGRAVPVRIATGPDGRAALVEVPRGARTLRFRH